MKRIKENVEDPRKRLRKAIARGLIVLLAAAVSAVVLFRCGTQAERSSRQRK